jgi:hypothetical protein
MNREIIDPTNEELCDLMCGKPEEDETWDINIEIPVNITMQDIDDILTTAFEGGINYWCESVKVDGEYLGEYASEQISRHGGLYLTDAEDDQVYYLEINSFLNGLKLYLKDNPELVENGTIDTCNVDADVADCIVQLAIFKEVVYG